MDSDIIDVLSVIDAFGLASSDQRLVLLVENFNLRGDRFAHFPAEISNSETKNSTRMQIGGGGAHHESNQENLLLGVETGRLAAGSSGPSEESATSQIKRIEQPPHVHLFCDVLTTNFS